VAEIAYRQAALADAAEILTQLLKLAPEIPLIVDTLEREEALYALIRNCARSGESWVAGDDGRIIGFALAERAQQSRHYAEHEVLELRYIGVAAAAVDSNAEIFAQLVARLLDRLVPVIAAVSPHNRSGLADALEGLGFRPLAATGSERQYRWQPGGGR
jgi:hypothetical protein